MTRYRIDVDAAAISIELTDVAGHDTELLDAFGECQQGQCSCPTDEYEKVAAMDVRPDGDRISIRLDAKPGQSFDARAIVACLDYTVAKVVTSDRRRPEEVGHA